MVNKVSEFELGLDSKKRYDEWHNFYYGREYNAWYNYPSADELLNNLDDLKDIIKDFLNNQVERLSYLSSYTEGRNYGIMHRKPRNDRSKADYRICHNYGDYIATFCSGYIFGNPARIETDDKKSNDIIDNLNRENKLDDLNTELAYDVSTYGRAFEIHYRGQDDKDKVKLSSVFETFLIYDMTVEHKKIAGVRISSFYKNKKKLYQIILYTDNKRYEFKPTDLTKNNDLIIDKEKPHFYDEVPIIEWKNGRKRMGDFESAISQIDAYDSAESDTTNYMNDLNDAMLVVKGDLNRLGLNMENMSKEKRKLIESLREDNILFLYTGINAQGEQTNLEADYIYKQYDVAGTEAHKERIDKDIHKFTQTPDLTDEKFSGNKSGEAMKYKTYGLDLKSGTKLNEFSDCLKNRYRLINNIRKNTSDDEIDIENIKITFKPKFPENIWNEIETFVSVGGRISNRTLIDKLDAVNSTDDEIERLKDEEGLDPYNDDFNSLKGAMIDEE